jgi:hypothetical protein
MNTPSHAILNLAVLFNHQPQAVLPIVLGGIVPDVPMFVLYFWAKKIRRQSERQIWSETFWLPFWQNINHSFHSIPLLAIGLLLSAIAGWQLVGLFFFSALLHCFGDLPLHNDDAHRHFLPFSQYRFISPLSYWDPRHHGRTVALVERLLVLAATLYLFPTIDSWLIKTLLIVVNGFYLTGYFYRLVSHGCVQAQSSES